MKAAEMRTRIRSALGGSHCHRPASVFDPMSARAAEELGFEMGMLAGSICSLVVLGAPDLVLLTLTEFADQARRVCRAATLPLMVDADHGYGNALNVMRTVQELEAAGVAALTIEDTLLPASFGTRGKDLVSIEEGAAKVRAAVQSRQDPNLVIVGRTSAPIMTDIDDTIRRLTAYEAAGADAVFAAGLKKREHLAALASAVSVPIMLGQAGEELRADYSYLAANKVRVCFEGHQPFYAALKTIYQTLLGVRDGANPASFEVADASLVQRLTRQTQFDRWSAEYLDDRG